MSTEHQRVLSRCSVVYNTDDNTYMLDLRFNSKRIYPPGYDESSIEQFEIHNDCHLIRLSNPTADIKRQLNEFMLDDHDRALVYRKIYNHFKSLMLPFK